MYDKIYEFCKVRNLGPAPKNGEDIPPRVKWLMKFIESLGIPFELDTFEEKVPVFNWKSNKKLDLWRKNFFPEGNEDLNSELDLLDDTDNELQEEEEPQEEKEEVRKYYNIVMKGSAEIGVTAHHDIVNPNSDNANDNSCSVINAIMVKKLSPETTVIILDGEECGGKGSNRASEKINAGEYGNIKSILNLELTGKGGKYFFIGNYPGPLTDKIVGLFNPPLYRTPYNDAVTFRQNGIDATVINPLPPIDKKTDVQFNDGKYLDSSMLYHCHSVKDSVSTIDPNDMKEFVEEIVIPILKN